MKIMLTRRAFVRTRSTTASRHVRIPRPTASAGSSIGLCAIAKWKTWYDTLDHRKLWGIYEALWMLILGGYNTGGAANWNFNLPGTNPLQNNQQRSMGTMGSFAQSLSGSQPATSLDLS